MALSGIRVLDLGGPSGRYLGRLLAGLGAEVLRPSTLIAATEASLGIAGRLYYESGKKEVREDEDFWLSGDEAPADILIEEGLDLEASQALAERWPQAIILHCTPFGASGPRQDWVGSDLVCASRAGMVFVNGHPGSAPLQPFGLQAYHAAGIWGVLASLLALSARRHTGRGDWIDLSVQAAAAAAVEHVTGLRRQGRAIPRRQGTLHWSRVFRGGPAEDGWILQTTAGDWQTLALWVHEESNQPELLEADLEEIDIRRERCDEIFDRLDQWAAHKSAGQIEQEGQLRRLTFAEIRKPERLADDPQLAARGFPGDRVGDLALPGPPLVFSRTPYRSKVASRAAAAWSSASRDLPLAGPCALPLAGCVVLDFTWVVAGPVTTRILADHGATVIKVEHLQSADFGTRRGGLTGNLNRGKQSLGLNMNLPGGQEIARRLAARADLVIDNFSARVMQNWGLDYPSLCQLRSDIIQVRLSGFGLSGPERDRVSYGPTLQAMAGLPHLMRHPDGPPAGWGYSWSDMVGGLMGAAGSLAALECRASTGMGQLVDVGQYGNLISLLGPGVCELLAGHPVAPPGNQSQEGAAWPHGVYRARDEARADGGAADRWLAIAILTDGHWDRFARILESDGLRWASADELRSLAGRLEAGPALGDRVAAWVASQLATAVEDRLQGAGIPAALVADADDLQSDEQLLARGYFPRIDTPEGETEIFDAIPFLAKRTSGAVRQPGPLRGEQGAMVLAEILQMSTEEIESLRAEGVMA